MSPIDHHSNPVKRPHALGTLLRLSAILLLSFSTLTADDDAPIYISDNPFVSEGYAQLQEGNSESALDAFKRALELNAAELSAHLGKAMIYAGLQQHEKAFSSYDTIIQTHPRHADAWNGRGLAAYNLEDFDEALLSFEQSTADQPVNGFFYESLAWTRMCRGEFEQAAVAATKATLMYDRKGESSIYPLLIAYFAYLETGDFDAAERTLNFAHKNRPVNQWPSPVVDYIAGRIDALALISFVMDRAQETEAHTYIGLQLRADQDHAGAHTHLHWVSRHGDPRVFEYTLARALKLRNSVAVIDR